jgi:hypothetical protein
VAGDPEKGASEHAHVVLIDETGLQAADFFITTKFDPKRLQSYWKQTPLHHALRKRAA